MSAAMFAIVIIRGLFFHNLFCALTHASTSALSPCCSLQALSRAWRRLGCDELGQKLCPSVWPGNQCSLAGLSRAHFKSHLCLCIWFNYPLQMSAWTLPSVPWQFSSSNCMIAPLKQLIWPSSVSLRLYPLFPFVLNYMYCFPHFKKKRGVFSIIKVILYMLFKRKKWKVLESKKMRTNSARVPPPRDNHH